MSMISELVDTLRTLSELQNKQHHERIINRAADTIEALSAKLANIERPAEDCGGGWILCSDRMPEENEEVICCFKSGLSKHLYCLTANFTEKCMHTKNLTLSHGNHSRSHTMSLNESITHGKEHRKPYQGAKGIERIGENESDNRDW